MNFDSIPMRIQFLQGKFLRAECIVASFAIAYNMHMKGCDKLIRRADFERIVDRPVGTYSN